MSEEVVDTSGLVGEQVPIEVSTSGPVSNGQRRAKSSAICSMVTNRTPSWRRM